MGKSKNKMIPLSEATPEQIVTGEKLALNFAFSGVEAQFHKFKVIEGISKTKGVVPMTAPNVISHESSQVLHFIHRFEQGLFLDIVSRDLRHSHDYLIKVQKCYSENIQFLRKLTQSYAAGYEENVWQLYFYERMIVIVSKLIDGSHRGFHDREALLNERPILKKIDLPKGVKRIYSNHDNRIFVYCSPEKLLNGFQAIQAMGKCEISDIEQFVFGCFKFKDHFKAEKESSSFTFKWNTHKHALTQLILDLKRKQKFKLSLNDLTSWVTLFVDVSGASIKKYYSGETEIKPHNRIDIQLFS